MSNPSGLWLIFNQFQTLLLLLITGAYIPKDIIDYLLGMEFTLFNFEFLGLNRIDFIDKGRNWSFEKQTEQNFEEIRLKSVHSFYNIYDSCDCYLYCNYSYPLSFPLPMCFEQDQSEFLLL